ncbi:ABC transporter ATP-binding protein [Leucobacter zeae]|nr:ABC transporter ATP-binding protein [Leucobacter zeae]
MPTSHDRASITLDRVGLAWPDGSVALDGVSGAFGSGRTGLVGRNGSGKSTLLKLISGELRPGSGTVRVDGEVAVLPQRLTLDVGRRVSELLGVAEPLDAVRAIAAGDVDPERFEQVGDDWDVEARSEAALAEAGLSPDFLDRSVGELSGGEAVLVAIAGIRLRRTPITLLDEPTNNLDRDARGRLAEMVSTWRGTLVVVSHDVSLLELMDDTAELHGGSLQVFGGPYSEWRAWLDAEQEAAKQAEVAAAQALRREKRQRIEAETKLAHRTRNAKKAFENKREPKIIMNGRKMAAEVSAGRLRVEVAAKEAAAKSALGAAGERVRSDRSLRIELPDPAVSRSRRIATIGDEGRSWIIQGPERVALIGRNGTGKTTLLRRLVDGDLSPTPGGHTAEAHTDRIGYLSQRVDGLDDSRSPLENLVAVSPGIPEQELRNRLARFLIRGASADRPVSSFSGGERFRIALATLLLPDPAPQLVVLDEPTNNLDLDTADRLVEALRAYRGALIIVSHDDAFLDRLGIDLTLEIDAEGGLREVSA